MGNWGIISKSPNINLGYSYYPAIWEDNGKIYCKAQGEYDVNIYDINTDTWSGINITNAGVNRPSFESTPVRHELIWIANNKLYCQHSTWIRNSDGLQIGYPAMSSYDLTTGAIINLWQDLSATFGTLSNPTWHGNWGRNRHKSAIKDPDSGRIFIINYYTKQIYEFLVATETFVLVKTWTESIGGNSADDISGCDAVCLNGYMYLIGIHNTTQGNNYSAGPVEINLSTWASSVKAGWPDPGNQAPFLKCGWYGAQIINLGNLIYVYGGKILGRDSGGYNVNSNFMYIVSFNPSTNAWATVSTISSSYEQASVITVSGKAYFFGGLITSSQTTATNAFEYILDAPSSFTAVYNPATGAVDLNWVDNSNEETNYIIERKRNDESTWTELAVLLADSDTTVDVHSHFYFYRICCEKAI